MASHLLSRLNKEENAVGYRWVCSICRKKWQAKPRGSCSGLPEIEARPLHLLKDNALKHLNLRPYGDAIACVYPALGEPKLLYHRNSFVIDNPRLPTIYDWNNRPSYLLTPNKLFKYNLQPGMALAKGCLWNISSSYWTYLYKKEDCEILDPNLPECFSDRDIPDNLKDCWELDKLHLKYEGVKPAGFYRYWSKRQENWVDVNLYRVEDCTYVPPPKFICKTSLRKTYFLSESWIKKLGDPDLVVDNPHYRNGADMLLYSESRVQQFLSDRASEYAQWLSDRQKYVAIFEQNKDYILAAARKAHLARQKNKVIAKTLGRLKNQIQIDVDLSVEDAEQILKIVSEQTALCLNCLSGCPLNKGFLCAVHPTGLPLDKIPCQDWKNSKSKYG